VPRERLGQHGARELQVPGDRLAGLAPARGQAVGDREQRHVGGDRGARDEVAVERAAVERLAAHEEAEPQVVAGERGDVVGQRGARAQPLGEHRARQSGADAVVAGEAEAALGARHRGVRLGDVVQQRGPAQAVAAGGLVGERLGEQRLDAGHEVGVAQRDRVLEHLERVAVGVLVVVDGLLEAPERLDLGEHDGERAGLAQPLDPGRREQVAQLGEDALAGHAAELRGGVASGRDRVPVRREAECLREAREAHDAQRVVGERARADGAQPPRREVVAPAEGVHHHPRGQILQSSTVLECKI